MSDDIEVLRAERDKYKSWFDWKSKANGRLLAELSRTNVEHLLLSEECQGLREALTNLVAVCPPGLDPDVMKGARAALAQKSKESDGFETWVARREWQVVLEETDQYGAVRTETVLSIWPSREQAIADLPNHVRNPNRDAPPWRWIPHHPKHDYEQIDVVCRDVRLPRQKDYGDDQGV